VGKITLVTKQKQMRKEKDISFNVAVSKTILDSPPKNKFHTLL